MDASEGGEAFRLAAARSEGPLMPSSMRDWLRLPSRIAMLLGLGALSVTGAKAGVPHPGLDGAPIPQQSAKAFGDLLIWTDKGRIFVSEGGKPAEELHLSGTAEAEALRQLLEREGATAATPHALRDRIILVGSGGSGLHWESARPDDPNKSSRVPAIRDTDKPAPEAARTTARVGATQSSRSADGSSK
jgi:hypothetical protein